MNNARPIGRWYADFLQALLLSTATVVLLTAMLSVLGWHEFRASNETLLNCSVTHCVFSRDGSQALVNLRTSEPGRNSPRQRLVAIDFRDRSCRPALLPFAEQPRQLVAGGNDTALVLDSAGRVMQRRMDGRCTVDASHSLPGECPDSIARTADGRALIALSFGQLRLYDLQLAEVRWTLPDVNITCVALHPQAGLFAAWNGVVVQLSLDSGAVMRVVALPAESLRAIAVDPRGASIAWLDTAGGITACRLGDGQLLWQQRTHGSQILPPTHRAIVTSSVLAFSPNGERLVTTAHEGEWILAIWDANTGERIKTLRGHDDRIQGAAFLADGLLASWGNDGTLRFWNVQRGALLEMFSPRELRSGEVCDSDNLWQRLCNLVRRLCSMPEMAAC